MEHVLLQIEVLQDKKGKKNQWNKLDICRSCVRSRGGGGIRKKITLLPIALNLADRKFINFLVIWLVPAPGRLILLSSFASRNFGLQPRDKEAMLVVCWWSIQ